MIHPSSINGISIHAEIGKWGDHGNWKTAKKKRTHPCGGRTGTSQLYSEILLLIGLFVDGKAFLFQGP
jgi:hypothetical protein